MKVLVLGATGPTGSNVINQLSSRKDVSLYAFIRNKQAAQKMFSTMLDEKQLSSINWIEGSLTDDKPSYLKIIDQIDYIIHCAASRGGKNNSEYDVAYRGMQILLANAKNVKKIVYVTSAYATRPNSIVAILLNMINTMTLKWKLEAENLLRSSGIPYCIIRPGRLVDEEIPDKGVEFYQGDTVTGDKTSRIDVARSCIECIDRSTENVTLEMINSSKSKTDFDKEFAKLKKDQEKVIVRNHNFPFFLIASVFGLGVLYFFRSKLGLK